jgi:hypothetical protein
MAKFVRAAIAATLGGSLLGFAALFAPTAEATGKADDCTLVATADAALCRSVKAQQAYSYLTGGGALVTVPKGAVLVKDITHDGLSKPQMYAALKGEAADYREHVTDGVCRKGQRDHGDYNRLCLHTGTPKTARGLWFSTPEGTKGRERDDDMTRRSICKFASRHGGITAAAVDLVTDMTYDNYRNNRQVNRWVAQDARLDCTQMGYRV